MRVCKQIIYIAVLVLVPLFAHAQVTEYVCITPGGGSSPEILAQYSRVYSTLALWEAQNLNLTTTNWAGSGGTKHVCHIIGDWSNKTPETGYTSIYGWTTSGVTNDIVIEVPETPLGGCTVSTRHSGVWSDHKFRLVPTGVSTGTNMPGIQINAANVTIDGVQILHQWPGKTSARGIMVYQADATIYQNTIRNNIIRMNMPHADSQAGQVVGISMSGSGITNFVHNNIVLDARTGTSLCYGIHNVSGNQSFITNNTVYNSYSGGINAASGKVYATNNISFGTVVANGDLAGTYTYAYGNACDSDETGGSNTIKPNWDTVFVSGSDYAGVSDFRLASASPLRDVGTLDFTSGVTPSNWITKDIQGNAFPQYKIPDIGAYEYVLPTALVRPGHRRSHVWFEGGSSSDRLYVADDPLLEQSGNSYFATWCRYKLRTTASAGVVNYFICKDSISGGQRTWSIFRQASDAGNAGAPSFYFTKVTDGTTYDILYGPNNHANDTSPHAMVVQYFSKNPGSSGATMWMDGNQIASTATTAINYMSNTTAAFSVGVDASGTVWPTDGKIYEFGIAYADVPIITIDSAVTAWATGVADLPFITGVSRVIVWNSDGSIYWKRNYWPPSQSITTVSMRALNLSPYNRPKYGRWEPWHIGDGRDMVKIPHFKRRQFR